MPVQYWQMPLRSSRITPDLLAWSHHQSADGPRMTRVSIWAAATVDRLTPLVHHNTDQGLKVSAWVRILGKKEAGTVHLPANHCFKARKVNGSDPSTVLFLKPAVR